MALADLLTDSNTGAKPINLGDSVTISVIGDKPAVDYFGLIMDATEAPCLVWQLERGSIDSSKSENEPESKSI